MSRWRQTKLLGWKWKEYTARQSFAYLGVKLGRLMALFMPGIVEAVYIDG
jgi:hypothetical protein